MNEDLRQINHDVDAFKIIMTDKLDYDFAPVIVICYVWLQDVMCW